MGLHKRAGGVGPGGTVTVNVPRVLWQRTQEFLGCPARGAVCAPISQTPTPRRSRDRMEPGLPEPSGSFCPSGGLVGCVSSLTSTCGTEMLCLPCLLGWGDGRSPGSTQWPCWPGDQEGLHRAAGSLSSSLTTTPLQSGPLRLCLRSLSSCALSRLQGPRPPGHPPSQSRPGADPLLSMCLSGLWSPLWGWGWGVSTLGLSSRRLWSAGRGRRRPRRGF